MPHRGNDIARDLLYHRTVVVVTSPDTHRNRWGVTDCPRVTGFVGGTGLCRYIKTREGKWVVCGIGRDTRLIVRHDGGHLTSNVCIKHHFSAFLVLLKYYTLLVLHLKDAGWSVANTIVTEDSIRTHDIEKAYLSGTKCEGKAIIPRISKTSNTHTGS